ncbi:hypothetical protein L9F63_015709, partial [Diploptera punctata]
YESQQKKKTCWQSMVHCFKYLSYCCKLILFPTFISVAISCKHIFVAGIFILAASSFGCFMLMLTTSCVKNLSDDSLVVFTLPSFLIPSLSFITFCATRLVGRVGFDVKILPLAVTYLALT